MAPDSAKRSDSAIRGGASVTIIRVEVKAEAQMMAKPTPIRIARISMNGPCCTRCNNG